MIDKKGFTLIETIIYITLFTVLMGSAFITAFQIIEGSNTLDSKTIAQEEINFVMRKMTWVWNGLSSIVAPSPWSPYSDTLTILKYDGTQVNMRLRDGRIELRDGVLNDFLPITSDNVVVSNLQFHYIDSINGSPEGLEASTTINGFVSTTTTYIRI